MRHSHQKGARVKSESGGDSAMKVKPIPDGYHSVTPYLVIRGAAAAIEFYRKAFGASVRLRVDQPDGKVGHAELVIGDSCVMLGDEAPEMGYIGPLSIGGCPGGLHLYVEDSDSVFRRAVELGAAVERPVQDQFYGDRSGNLRDPFGYRWTISTHREDLTPEEMAERQKAGTKP
jgi:PhnB protein